ncbi:ATP-dependent nuclease [Chryseolinea soli]|uniref:ATPase AAA-type core domain-containing protein n=1 Tax=Chryseolinea soli TaxID=2321403 RepID=A0A385SXY6_9BACT|nr:AAA family ATPase [Chryseolinea soli]AYB34915.1 hypothetical protein D4L85_31960 [Chryseolinea soli]
MTHVLLSDSEDEHNDVSVPDLFAIRGHLFVFKVIPATDYWRFGVRFVIGNRQTHDGTFKRYKDTTVKHIEICAGERSNEQWRLPNRLQLQQYTVSTKDHVLYRADGYQPKTPVSFKIEWIKNGEVIIYVAAEGIETHVEEIDLGAHSHFKAFAWADKTPYEITSEITVSTLPMLSALKDTSALQNQTVNVPIQDLTIFFGRNNSGKTSALVAACHIPRDDNDHAVDYIGVNRNFTVTSYNYINENKADRKSIQKNNRRRRTQKDDGYNQPFDWVEELSLQDREDRKKILDWMAAYFEPWLLEKEHSGEYHVGNQLQANGMNPITQGTGARSVFPIIIQLFNPEVALLSIDEPELALEAGMQKILFKVIKEASQGLGGFPRKRIILATHSHLFLDRIAPTNNFQVSKKNGTVEIKQLQDHKSIEYATYQLLGHTPADLFFPSNIIIVEGAIDQIFLTALHKHLLSAGRVKNEKIAFHFVDGIGNAATGSVAALQMFKTQSYSPVYKERICGIFDQPHNPAESKAIAEIKKYFNADADRRFLVIERDAIEYYYPVKIINKLFNTKLSMETYQAAIKVFLDSIPRNSNLGTFMGETISKKQLVNKVVEAFTDDDLDDVNPAIVGLIILACERGF